MKNDSMRRKRLLASAFVGGAAFLFSYKGLSTADKPQENLREVLLLETSSLEEGQMREVHVGPGKDDTVLVSKIDGKFYCTGSKCTHFGAPLAQGVLFADQVMCPWHCASFNIKTGYLEGGPVVDGLQTYEIREEGGKLYAKIPEKLTERKVPPMAKYDPNDHRRFVIVGTGPAAIAAAETLRQSDYTGEIVLVSQDENLPYDRTILTKVIHQVDVNKILIRDSSFFESNNIKVITGARVNNINAKDQLVEVEGREPIKYDKVLIATGASPRAPPVPGVDLRNVFTIRNYNDVLKVREATNNAKNIVIVGSSFIGLEAASSLKKTFKDNATITVVDMVPVPFQHIFGEQVGKTLQNLHQKNGVSFQLGKGLKAIQGEGQVQKVVLADGTEINADVVILGTGVAPNTKFISNVVELERDGGVKTDPFLRTSQQNIFAAGDIVSRPCAQTGKNLRVEHYIEAFQQGANAAFNMLGKLVPYDSVPFFWSRQWDQSVGYTGFQENFDDVYIDGNLDELKFIALYLKENRVVAASSMGRSPALMIINQALRLGLMPSAQEIKSGKFDLEALRRRVGEQKQGCRCQRERCCKKAPKAPETA